MSFSLNSRYFKKDISMTARNNNIIKNASWIIVCRVVQSILSFVIGMVSARYLGPSNYGLISYASSIVAFVVPVVQLGLRNTLVQEIIADPEHEGQTLGTSLFMSISTSFLGIVGVVGFVSIANRSEKDTIIVCTLYSFSLIFQMAEMIEYWYQAKLLSKYTSVTSLIAYTIVSAYKIYLLIAAKSIYWFAVTSALDYLLISIILFIIYSRIGTQRLSVSLAAAKRLFSKSKYYIVSGMMVTVFSQTDKIMLKQMIDDTANGYYSAAVTCASITSFVFGAIIDSFRPIIFESKNKSQESFEKNMTRLYSIIIYSGLAQCIFLTLFSGIIVTIVYGSAYAASITILRIVTWYTAFSYMGSVRNIWILAEEKQSLLWRINLSGALLNVIGNLILIPRFGANGAAAASVVTQFFTNFILCFVIKALRPSAKIIFKSLNPKILLELLHQKEKLK